MPLCTRCGRPLAEGETCSCSTASQNTAQNNYAQQPQYNSYDGQPYSQDYLQKLQFRDFWSEQPHSAQKKSSGWIIGLVTGIVLLVLIVAAMIFFPMVKTINHSKRTEMMSRADNLRKAGNTAMIEMKEEGTDLRGVYIISSDEKDNVAVPFDTGDFYKKLRFYFFRMNKTKFFIVVRDGTVEYAAVSETWTKKTKKIGSWPPGTDGKPREYSKDGSSVFSDKKTNLDTLYWEAYDQIFG